MTIENIAKQLEPEVDNLVVMDESGKVLASKGSLTIDPNIISTIANKEPSVTLHGIKYTTLTVEEDRYIALSIPQQEYFAGIKTGDKWVFFTTKKDPKDIINRIWKKI
mgnify:CR=1 FL=1